MLCISRDPTTRLRDIAADLGMTERRAYDIVNDLCEAGYVRKERDGRRNRYEVQGHLPLPEDPEQVRPIGEVLQILSGRGSNPARSRGMHRPPTHIAGPSWIDHAAL